MRGDNSPINPAPVKYSEDWAATVFTKRYGEAVRFVHTTKRWLYWDGGEWQWDRTLRIQNAIRDMCRIIATDARQDANLNGAQRAQTAQRFSSGRIIHGIELILRSEPVHSFKFDRAEFAAYPPEPENGARL